MPSVSQFPPARVLIKTATKPSVASVEGVNRLKNRSELKECERRTELRALVGTCEGIK